MSDHDSKLAYFRIELGKTINVTRERIRDLVAQGPFPLLPAEQEEIVRQLEASFDIRQLTGASVKADYTPWLGERRKEVDFFYWQRLKRYLLERDVLPPHVISTLDQVTDEILDYSGNPADPAAWARRGMVIGHVQSGKTTNYAALICKAADCGYKIVILLAGITNSLRTQTQERLDESFIGKKSVFHAAAQEQLSIVNYANQKRFPAYGTSRDRDFLRAAASTYGVSLAALKEPIIFVTKKNKMTLESLRDWLREQNQGHSVPDALLLIDDEADNASINTAADSHRVTGINQAIRQILALFSRSTYIGYTATPFANIFIDPASEDEMLGDDLFPKNFIKALDPPSNYVGASRVFSPIGNLSSMVREVEDYQDLLPLKHKRDANPIALPNSLYRAVRMFILARSIRILRNDRMKHASMMVNVSRFNDVQDRVHGLIYRYLEELRNSIIVNAGLGMLGSRDQDLAQLQDDFFDEYSDAGFGFDKVLEVLSDAVSSVQVTTVNMRGGTLDYLQHKKDGLHVIAIGGLALSRGLTLEGLTVSYILRNASASDTLMQMARWFGYRPGYEDVCRLYLPEDARGHYEYITEAIEELRAEVKRMDLIGMTPRNFGLRVRQSPAAIRVTAANKMRNATQLTVAQDYSGQHVEGYALANDETINQGNLGATKAFLGTLGEPDELIRSSSPIWRTVDGSAVLGLITRFAFAAAHTDLGPIQGSRSLFVDYVAERAATELGDWEVVVPLRSIARIGEVQAVEITSGIWGALRQRAAGVVRDDSYKITRKNKAANPGDEQIGLSAEAVEAAKRSGLPGARAYCMQRSRPLMLIHFLNPTGIDRLKLGNVVVTLSFCLPETRIAPVTHRYQVNAVYRQQLLELAPEADDDEPILDQVADA